MRIPKPGLLLGILLAVMTAALSSLPAAASEAHLLKGQTVYVPAYPHVFHGVKRDIQLNSTLMIRNIDPNHALKITRVDYHDSAGKLLRSYLRRPVKLAPLSSTRFTVEKAPPGGKGTGGSAFIVDWNASKKVNPPLVETINIGTSSSQGISFVAPGVPLELKDR